MTVQTTITEADRAREAAELEQRGRAAARRHSDSIEAALAQGDGMEALKALLGFLFDFIFGDDPDAPNEGPGDDAPVSRTDQIRTARAVIDSRAMPRWQEFQRDHAGQQVIHRSPVAGAAQITSDFGPRSAASTGGVGSRSHKGIDFGARDGDRTPDILASADGIVIFSGRKQGYGNTVVIGHADGTTTLYGHMTGDNMPAVGSEVRQGQVIGEMGRTGNSTAVHLHYEQRRDNVAMRPRINGQQVAVGSRLNGQEVLASNHDHSEGDGHDHSPAPAAPVRTAANLPQAARAAAREAARPAVTSAAPADSKPQPTYGNGKFEVSDIKDGAVAMASGISTRLGSLFRA
jgi:murein DD-endopeptidase MepM/ murein hydrolase activator NlpD